MAHAVGAFSILAASLVPIVKAVLLLCLGASLAAQRRPRGRVDAEFRPDGTIQLTLHETNSPVGAGDTPLIEPPVRQPLPLALDRRTQILGPLVVLLFPPESKLRPLVLLRDSFASTETYRRLRIWLKWSGARPTASSGPWSGHGLQDRI